MTQKISPYLDVKYGWDLGESGWNVGMDENLVKFSFLLNNTVDEIVQQVPSNITNKAYYVSSSNEFYFSASGITYFVKVPKWFSFKVASTGKEYTYNGTSLIENISADSVDQKLQLLQDSLGSAAFVSSDNFTTNQDLSSASQGEGSDLIAVRNTRPNSVVQSLTQVTKQVVSAKEFGCVCNGHLGASATDDSANLQKAINYCLSMSPPAILEVPGLCRIDSSVLIERLVDATENSTYFTIRGSGEGGGFYAHFGVTMFTAYPSSTAWVPESQKVRFENISFVSLAPTNPTYALEGRRFLNIDFSNCSFYRMRAATSETYYQTWYFNNCSAYGYVGTFLEGTGGSYDVHFNMCKIQAGGKFIDITQSQARGQDRTNFYVTNSHIQAMTSAAITADSVSHVSITENYFEFVNHACNFATNNNLNNLSPNNTIVVSANLFAPRPADREDPAYFDILWGRTKNGVAYGNFVTGNTIEGSGLKLHKLETTSHVVLINEPSYPGIQTTEGIGADLGYIQPGTGEALKTIRGSISSAGAVVRGKGFTATKLGTGNYRINFSTPFSAVPTATYSLLDSNGTLAVPLEASSAAGSVVIIVRSSTNALVDSAFNFICTGPA